MKKQILRMLTGVVAFIASGVAFADELNMRVGVTDISRQVYDLHMTIFYICVAIGVVVFGVLFWSVFRHRKSLGVVPATFHESTKMELAWTIVPTLILIVMAIPGDPSTCCNVRYRRRRHEHRSSWLPVEVAI